MAPDSWDWVANGIYWSGASIASTFRPPGLPLVVALLHRLSALPLLPYLNFAMLGLAAILLHRLVRLRHTPLVSALAVLLFVSNGSLFGYTRFVMAEVWTLPFLIAAAIAFVRAAEQPRRYLLCAALLSVSFLFHYAGAVVAAGFGVATVLYRREVLATRWPWLALGVAIPLQASWMVVRGLHNRSSENVHGVLGLLHPSLDNLWYFTVVAIALVGLAALPLYLMGFVRLVSRRDGRLAPWTQAVLFPPLALALFFTLLYDWPDKRFLYYLFPFAVAIASEGIFGVLAHAQGSRLRAALATLAMAAALLWNRIPYPATTHDLLAVTPRDFLDAADGVHTAQMHSVSSSWAPGLFATDGFFTFRAPEAACLHRAELAASPELRNFLAERMGPDEPIALAGRNGNPTSYWIDTNRMAIALERPIVKPGAARFVLRWLETPDSRALTTIGPWELFGPADEVPARKQRRHRHRAQKSTQQLPAPARKE